MDASLYRKLPKMDTLIALPACRAASARLGAAFVKEEAAKYLDALRLGIRDGSVLSLPSLDRMEQALSARFCQISPYALRRVINATGVILHTNLGRAPLGAAALDHVLQTMRGYCSLEYDPLTGKRGDRAAGVEALLTALTGAEDAMVVNNNAAAVFLLLHAHAGGRRVAISRGELVEIGGAFRVPEILKESGAELVEVGTTNRTNEADYERAILENGASVLLKVHASNFCMEGYTKETSLESLVRLGRAHACPVFFDAGAAFLLAPEQLGLHAGVTVQKCVESGADAVCFSADKLIGSVQAGILVGKKKWIEPLKRNQLARILRPDKVCLAALEASLRLYAEPKLCAGQIPFLAMASLTKEACLERAKALLCRVREAVPNLAVSILPVLDEVGGGALPGVRLAGSALHIVPDPLSPEEAAAFLRNRPVPIVARILSGGVVLSVRTLLGGDTDELTAALSALADLVTSGGPSR